VRLIPTTRGGALGRFGLCAVLVIGLVGATTAVAGLLQVQDLVTDISLSAPLKHADVTIPPPGSAQTLLVIGSDHRAGTSYTSANTDTMLMIRLDPNSSTINLLSIPRDLEVQIPSGGTQYSGKLNSAYSVGGPNLLVSILKNQVFQGFHVNHIIDVNFAGFSDLIDAIGCVDTDVDHRYYNNTAQTDYSSIDIQPGYQKLCGDNQSISGALAFVRFRHTDSDIVRNARQQDFIRWAKEGYSVGRLVANRNKLLSIFGKHAQTDKNLHSLDGLLSLFDLFLNLDGHEIKTIPFPAILGNCGGVGPNGQQTPCYVTATAGAERAAYAKFIAPTIGAATPKSAASSATTASKHGKHHSGVSDAGLIADSSDGQAQAAALGRSGLPVYYPRMIQSGSEYCSSISGNCNDYPNPASEYIGSYPREYRIHSGAHAYPSYRMTLVINSALGEYYGVQGTTWRDPPILTNPTQTQMLGGKKLLEYFNGSKLSLVAWKTSTGVYWISNSLSDVIPNHQMEAIAASLKLGG
jgi:LCP family protein required for cell wall assembly